jgi:hypothetical protein
MVSLLYSFKNHINNNNNNGLGMEKVKVKNKQLCQEKLLLFHTRPKAKRIHGNGPIFLSTIISSCVMHFFSSAFAQNVMTVIWSQSTFL